VDVVDTLNADIAAVDGFGAADALLTSHRQLQSTPIIVVKAATSRQV